MTTVHTPHTPHALVTLAEVAVELEYPVDRRTLYAKAAQTFLAAVDEANRSAT